MSEADRPFPFVQFEFAFPVGPADGRYLKRTGAGGAAERVIVIRTLGAPERRRLRRRRPTRVKQGDPAPVPTVRTTIIRAEPLDRPEAEGWLDGLRRDRAALEAELRDASRELNHLLRAHRAASGDPYVRELVGRAANVVRIGYGSGELVADGRFDAAYEVPAEVRRRLRRAEMLAPQERLAAILGGRDEVLASEELVLRARVDIDADRPREAALQARIALEAILAELPAGSPLADLEAARPAVGTAANAALEGLPTADMQAAVAGAVEAMERALRRFSTERTSSGG